MSDSKWVSFVAVRQGSRGVETLAIIRAKVNDRELWEQENFRKAIKRAVTKWIETTDDGRIAWEDSCQDFNVGDLAMSQTDPELLALLLAEGIEELSIETESFRYAGLWSFDALLADPDLPDSEGFDD